MPNPTGTINADQDHTGRTIIKADPAVDQDAATKKYVDDNAGGGVTAFTDLSDVPASYTGESGKLVAVNTGETALEFLDLNELSIPLVSDVAYDATTWNGDTSHAPSKNAVRDKIESMSAGSGVTNIATTSPITGGPITTTGTVALDVSVDHAFTAAQSVTLADAATNTTMEVLNLSHNSSATPLASFGTGILLKGKSDTTNDRNMGDIAGVWLTPTDASRTAYLRLRASNNAGFGTGLYVFRSDGVSLGNATDPGAQILSASGYKIGTASATTGTFLQGNGTSFIGSNYALPSSAGSSGYSLKSDGTNFVAYPNILFNASVSDNTGFAADTYLTGSTITVAAGDFKAKGVYRCVFDMVKTGAGTAAATIDVRIGTLGTTSDNSRMTFTFGAGTAVADTGTFEVIITFRTVGSGTSAIIAGICRATHNLATTGLFSDAAAWTIVGTTSAGFASNTATKIGLSFNGGSSFSGTNKLVEATLNQP